MPDQKTPREYRLLPYRRLVEIERGEESGRDHFVAYIEEIPWIRVPGESREEALLNLDEMFDDCMQAMLDEGTEIPEPVLWPGYHGEVLVEQMRLPVGDKPERAAVVEGAERAAPWTEIEQGNVELAGTV
ncbi:MAG: type II toxin-antitoxin system HicB family antitoxin [Gemmatimonadota bacterium]